MGPVLPSSVAYATMKLLSAGCLLTLALGQGMHLGPSLSQNGNGHSGIPRHLHTHVRFHPVGGIVGVLWECEILSLNKF